MSVAAVQAVHVLHHGFPLCGFTTDTPGRWPEGHVWVHRWDLDLAALGKRCAGCEVVAKQGSAAPR